LGGRPPPGLVAERIRGSSDKAAQHLAHALGESVAGGNPGTPYALSHPACITSRCPYKLTYFPGYSVIAIQENSWVGYPGISQRAGKPPRKGGERKTASNRVLLRDEQTHFM
jgi:hypothetical protein